ncbi:MAG: hypothetical protein D6814_16705 [Calditrichaeota bacterium]|nr:MAG: hypothetical protein D6814_16705 [Calditrichota bacterium]
MRPQRLRQEQEEEYQNASVQAGLAGFILLTCMRPSKIMSLRAPACIEQVIAQKTRYHTGDQFTVHMKYQMDSGSQFALLDTLISTFAYFISYFFISTFMPAMNEIQVTCRNATFMFQNKHQQNNNS